MRSIKAYRFILIPFSFIYLVITFFRNLFYNLHIFKIHSLDARVISVGNITWGGTGKTPAVLFMLEELLKRKSKVALLTRGYGDDEQGLFSILAPGVPVLVGNDRVRKGLEAIARHSVDTLLLDDGFQYRRLKRDLDIVCIDATNPFGNGWVIPAGSMREGLGALKRADIFLITKTDLAEEEKVLQGLEDKLKRVNPNALIVKSVHRVKHFYRLSDRSKVSVDELKNKEIVLVSAIGNPYSFEKTILRKGLNIKRHFVFRDHYWYKEKDLKKIESYSLKHRIDTVITTEKDAVKLKAISYQLSAISFLVLSIELKVIENEKDFYNRLFSICNS